MKKCFMKMMVVYALIGVCTFAFGQEKQKSGDFEYIIEETDTGRTIAIISYTGTSSTITFPAAINGIPVTLIGLSHWWIKSLNQCN